jgi:hypothetical protein
MVVTIYQIKPKRTTIYFSPPFQVTKHTRYTKQKMVSSSDSRANQRGREPSTTEVTGADAQLTVTEVGKSFIFYYPKGKDREDRYHPPSF